MADTIPNWIVQQYADAVEHRYQQMMAWLRQFARLKTGIRGERASFDRLGVGDFVELVGRHSPTEGQDPDHTRRWVAKRDWTHTIFLDPTDELEILINAQEAYIQNGAFALGRLGDRRILRAAEGNAYQGKETTSTIALPSGQKITTVGGMTTTKFRQAREILSTGAVALDDLNAGTLDAFVAVVAPKAMRDLLGETEATSTDYVGVVIVNGQEQAQRMPLVGGKIPFYMGFRIIQSNDLTLTGAQRQNLFWHKAAVGLALWEESFMSVDVRPDLNYTKQVYRRCSMEATRIQDEGVVQVESTE